MLINQNDFKHFLSELGFVKSERGVDEIYIYVYGENFCDCCVYFTGSCPIRVSDDLLIYDATVPQVDIVDFIKKGMKAKEMQDWYLQNSFDGEEAKMDDDWDW